MTDRTTNEADRREALELAGRIRWFVGCAIKVPTPLRNDLLGAAAGLETFANGWVREHANG